MSHFGSRGRGRGGGGGSSRSGLLGSAPGARKPGLLDSLGPRGNQHAPQFQDQQSFDPPNQRQKAGLLGNAPNNWQEPSRGYDRPPKQQQYQEPHHEPDYSYQEPEQYRGFEGGQRGKDLQEQPQQRGSDSLPPQIQHIMANLGLSKADMEELSRLPEKELSSSNLLQVIKNLRDKKAAGARPVPSPHDRAQIQSHQGHGRQSFDSRERSPERKALYDPSEPTDDYGNTERYEEQRFAEGNRGGDAFSSFQEKWYSDGSKDERDRGDAQPAGSILRGSRGPVVRATRWERDDRPAPPKQPRRLSPPQRRSPPPIRRPSPPPIRRPSPPQQRRRPSPMRQHSPPRRMSPPPRRMSSPPRMQSQMQQRPRGSLLGDPCDPSTQELDLLAATINHSRPQPPQNVYHPPERSYPGPERFHQPMRPRSPQPPPLLQQPTRPPRQETAVLQAQIQAMQVLQSEAVTHQAFKPQPVESRGGPPPDARWKGEKKLHFSKDEAQIEASKMRSEQGRVLYLRYRAGGMSVIREEHLVRLAQPFEKVTNILLVAPKNLITGWYQAFVELSDFDGAAAMCEHYMVRPPMVEGIAIQVQRSKYKDLKLRDHQMHRDFDKLLFRKEVKRQHPASLSPDRSKKRFQKSSSAERRSFSKEKEKKGSIMKKTGSNNTKSVEKPKIPDEKPKRNDNEKQTTKSKTEPKGTTKEGTEDRDLKNGTAKAEVKDDAPVVKIKIGGERVEIIRENLEQASVMSEALLKIVQQKSAQATINEILEYLSDSLDQLKELEKE